MGTGFFGWAFDEADEPEEPAANSSLVEIAAALLATLLVAGW
jgi:hypothetical protein